MRKDYQTKNMRTYVDTMKRFVRVSIARAIPTPISRIQAIITPYRLDFIVESDAAVRTVPLDFHAIKASHFFK